VLGEILGKSFLHPKKNEVISAIAKLRDKQVNRGTPYSPASIQDFKKAMKKFVKYVNDGELAKFWSDIHAEKISPEGRHGTSLDRYPLIPEDRSFLAHFFVKWWALEINSHLFSQLVSPLQFVTFISD